MKRDELKEFEYHDRLDRATVAEAAKIKRDYDIEIEKAEEKGRKTAKKEFDEQIGAIANMYDIEPKTLLKKALNWMQQEEEREWD